MNLAIPKLFLSSVCLLSLISISLFFGYIFWDISLTLSFNTFNTFFHFCFHVFCVCFFLIYFIFIFIFGCIGSLLSLVAESGGHSSLCGLLIAVASPAAEHGL